MLTFIVHGGAGALLKNLKTGKHKEEEFRAVLKKAAEVGYQILKEKKSGEEAVEKAITILEDSELFNAGHGAALNHAGDAEMDAGFASGDGAYGGVGLIRYVKNPIKLARLVKNKCPHLYLFGEGAIEFAKKENLEMMPMDYFKTEKNVKDWKDALKNGGIFLEEVSEEDSLGEKTSQIKIEKAPNKKKSGTKKNSKFGTVGAVAFDHEGKLFAGTSTGGLSNKWVGRIGDSPIWGAGTFASQETCALSATGKGEEIIKVMFSSQVHFMMKYKRKNLYEALKTTILKSMPDHSAGAISIDFMGRPALFCNTEGMFSALCMDKKITTPHVMITKEEIDHLMKKISSFFDK